MVTVHQVLWAGSVAKSSEWSSETVPLDVYLWVLGLSVAHVTYVTHAIAGLHFISHLTFLQNLALSLQLVLYFMLFLNYPEVKASTSEGSS